ncbi:MAG TPA: ATP-binding protein [Burkholderiaceae bacterium]|nr:ATP-binding protein [Burkholderiaceae bacterium]
MRSPPSLRRNLLLHTLVGVALVWCAMAAWVFWDAEHEVEELLDAHLAQVAALLMVRHGDGGLADAQERRSPPILHEYGTSVAYQVFDGERVVMRSSNAGVEPLAPQRPGFATVRSGGQAWRVFATPADPPRIWVYVAEQMTVRDDIMWAILSALVIPLACVLPLIVLMLYWATGRGLRPLEVLRQLLRARDVTSTQAVHMDGAPAELLPLLGSLNDLLLRLADKVEAERRFTADAAHELRTPIAAIRTQAQVALGALPTDADAAIREPLRATLQGCDRATHVVEQLLALAQLEGAHTPQARPFALIDALQPVCAELALAGLRRQQVLELDLAADLIAHGHLTLWQILMRNLIDNALRYSPPGATVHIQAHASGDGGIQVTVEDSGPGLSPQDISRLGERFFRVLGTRASGSGLGWSIVRRIADLQGLTIEVSRSAALGGLMLDIRQPPSERALAGASGAHLNAG